MNKHIIRKSPVRIPRRIRLGIYIVGVGVWATGGLWLLLHFFFARQGEFGPSVNPAEPWTMKLHGLFSFASIWLLGLLWGMHISTAWPLRRRRFSGGILVGVLLLLVLSGYLLYYAGEEGFRRVVSTVHWVVGLTIPALFAWHRWKRTKRKITQMPLENVAPEALRD